MIALTVTRFEAGDKYSRKGMPSLASFIYKHNQNEYENDVCHKDVD